MIQRVASSARRGLAFRSWKNASCLRRKRFSAAGALRDCAAARTSRTKSGRTEAAVRTQCCRAPKKMKEAGMNAQDRTLQNVTRLRFRPLRSFCGEHGLREKAASDPAFEERRPLVRALVAGITVEPVQGQRPRITVTYTFDPDATRYARQWEGDCVYTANATASRRGT